MNGSPLRPYPSTLILPHGRPPKKQGRLSPPFPAASKSQSYALLLTTPVAFGALDDNASDARWRIHALVIGRPRHLRTRGCTTVAHFARGGFRKRLALDDKSHADCLSGRRSSQEARGLDQE